MEDPNLDSVHVSPNQEFIATAATTYESLWARSAFTNLPILRYILCHAHNTSAPWSLHFSVVDTQMRQALVVKKTLWQYANQLIKKKRGICMPYYGRFQHPPVALEPLPEIFCRGGTGTCTTWAMSFNEDTYLDGGFVDYEVGHRLVFKRLYDRTAVVVDSGAQRLLCLNPGDKNDPHRLAHRVDAINACIMQLWRKAAYMIVIYREINANGLRLGRQIQFSARHRAFKLVPVGSMDSNVEASYILFGYGVEKDLQLASSLFEGFVSTTLDDLNKTIVGELLSIFEAARKHWGPPMIVKFSEVRKVVCASWPDPFQG